ncbi:MAG TPA: conjugal transfer protein TrbL family protein [Ktedonobacteraceae bacterium]|nr:conjugal transfer protein TrbL family protein [Ktedonobacteraceae bacterium]
MVGKCFAAFRGFRFRLRPRLQTRKRQISHLGLQALLVAALILVGLGLLHPQHTPASFLRGISSLSSSIVPSAPGRGAGNSAVASDAPGEPTLCNPFDPACFANAVGGWAAGAILSGLQPVTTFFQNSSTNIVTQTPPDDSYANATIITINQTLVHVVDIALACLLLIGGYNVILGHHVRIERSSITELLPRAILVTGAVHFNLLFLGLFIDFNNALCNTVIAAASAQTLTNIIGGFLSINPFAGMMLVLLIIVVAILLILLFAQMITRIALVALLTAVAPLALACLMLPQTMRWGRLWLTAFSSAVLVQFLQVTALTLGGILITSIGDTPVWHFGHELAEVFLAIGIVVITLKIPGMLQTWALHPLTTSSGWLMDQTVSGVGGGDSGSAGSSGETAAKVAELLALL